MRHIPATVEVICLVLNYIIFAIFLLLPLAIFVIKKKKPRIMPWWAIFLILSVSSYVLVNLFFFLKYLSGWNPGGPELGFALILGWLYLPIFTIIFYCPLYILILLISRLTCIDKKKISIVVSVVIVIFIVAFWVYLSFDKEKRHIISNFTDIKIFDENLYLSGIVVDNTDVMKVKVPNGRFKKLQKDLQNKGYSEWTPLSTLESKNFSIAYKDNAGLIYSISPHRRTDGLIPVVVYDTKKNILYMIIAEGVGGDVVPMQNKYQNSH